MTTITIDQPQQIVHLEKDGDYEVILTKRGAEVEIKGGWQVSGNEQQKINVRIIHRAPQTRSSTLLRAVARDRGQITLNGTIVVEPNAGQVNAFLTENILLLSPTAVAHAIPNLEISTDEVKCSHAATVSSIPESQLFYLMSRGIPRETAQQLIVDGFLDAVKIE